MREIKSACENGRGHQPLQEKTDNYLKQQQKLIEKAPSGISRRGFRGRFEHVIWKSLLNAPPLAELIQEWIYELSEQLVTSLPESQEQQWKLLLDYLQRQRCLLILDNLESMLQGEAHSGVFLPGYEEYGRLLRYLAEAGHRSSILITSRERPFLLATLDEENPAVRFLSLSGVPAGAGSQILAARGISGDPASMGDLVEQYSGNPLALKLAADTVQEVFAGNVAHFLQAETVVFDDIRHVLDQQFARLTPVECELMIWLAVVREPILYNDLRALLAQPPAPRVTLEAVRSLLRRSLVEMYEGGFGLQNVVLEYCADLLIENVMRELVADDGGETAVSLRYTNCIALTLTHTKEYIRASQIRLLLQPVAQQLTAQLGVPRTGRRLKQLLAQLQSSPLPPGYAAANLLHLLLHLEVDLRGHDFSRLYFRQLDLRGVRLPRTNFAQAKMVESMFTEPFGIVNTAVFSPDGHYLAAGTAEGTIYIWQTFEQQIVRVLPAHDQAINELAFGQRLVEGEGPQLLLASASNDRSIGIWSLAEREEDRWQVRLEAEQQKLVLAVGFQAGGRGVTAVDKDGQVLVWDITRPDAPQLEQTYDAVSPRLRLVAYSGNGQIVAVGNRGGTVQLLHLTTGRLITELFVETGPITALALNDDGRLLVTGGKEGHLCFWMIPEGKLQQVIESKRGAIDALAFSADGKMVASTHGVGDHAIRLWVAGAGSRWRLRQTLLGHRHMIWSAAFGSRPEPYGVGNLDGRRPFLVTGSSDQTVRVWDVETGQLLYTRRGQPRAFSAIAIRSFAEMQLLAESSQGKEWLLAAAGYDHLVHLWTGEAAQVKTPSRTLRGTDRALYGVAISPDGRIIAGAGHDKIIYLWDFLTGALLQTCHGHTNSIYRLAFHPNGELLASGSTDGTVRLWNLPDLETGQSPAAGGARSDQPAAVLQCNPQFVYHIAFSPDGGVLAAVGSGPTLCFWDMTQSEHPRLKDASKMVQAVNEHDIYYVAFSPDRNWLACGSNSLVYLWNLQNDAPPQKLKKHRSAIFSVAFSPDSSILASGGPDCTVCLWDVARGALRTVLTGHTDTVYDVAFSPDGAYVLSCSFDGAIKFWDVRIGSCVQTVTVEEPYAGMNITHLTGVTDAQKVALQALGAVTS